MTTFFFMVTWQRSARCRPLVVDPLGACNSESNPSSKSVASGVSCSVSTMTRSARNSSRCQPGSDSSRAMPSFAATCRKELRAVPRCGDVVPQRIHRRVGTREIEGRNLGGPHRSNFAHRMTRFDEEAAELQEEPFQDVGRNRHRSLRHTGRAMSLGSVSF